jgi:dienelactone hydrolase
VDARWAIGQANARLERKLPICLVGHSLGGRAALLAAGEPQVLSAVALAPWVLSSDQARGVDGKRILVVHGSLDRIASPARSRALAEGISGRADVTYVVVDGARHAMLRHHRRFSRLTSDFANESLLEARDLQRVAG